MLKRVRILSKDGSEVGSGSYAKHWLLESRKGFFAILNDGGGGRVSISYYSTGNFKFEEVKDGSN